MRNQLVFRLLGPVSAALARQLSEPRGWFGRAVVTRVLNRGNRELIQATLDRLELTAGSRLLDVGFGGGQYVPSEANQVVGQYNRLNEIEKQHVLNFLRAL